MDVTPSPLPQASTTSVLHFPANFETTLPVFDPSDNTFRTNVHSLRTLQEMTDTLMKQALTQFGVESVYDLTLTEYSTMLDVEQPQDFPLSPLFSDDK